MSSLSIRRRRGLLPRNDSTARRRAWPNVCPLAVIYPISKIFRITQGESFATTSRSQHLNSVANHIIDQVTDAPTLAQTRRTLSQLLRKKLRNSGALDVLAGYVESGSIPYNEVMGSVDSQPFVGCTSCNQSGSYGRFDASELSSQQLRARSCRHKMARASRK